MYAISFDIEVAKLKEHYGEPYNKAYDEIRAMMEELGFIKAVFIFPKMRKTILQLFTG